MAERVCDRAEPVAPELVLDLHRRGRARVDGFLHHCVDVLDVHEDADARAAQLRRRLGARLWERIRQHHVRVADDELRVPDPPVGAVHADGLFGAEGFLVVLDRLRRVVDGQIGRHRVVALGNWLYSQLPSPFDRRERGVFRYYAPPMSFEPFRVFVTGPKQEGHENGATLLRNLDVTRRLRRRAGHHPGAAARRRGRASARLDAQTRELTLAARPRGRRDRPRRRSRARAADPCRSGGHGPEDVQRRRGAWADDPNADAWFGDNPPLHVPVFILTHHDREPVVKDGGTTYHFVTDGVESALVQARAAAGEKDVQLSGGASVAQQYLSAGLLDELNIHVAPIVLDGGVSLFGEPGADGPKLKLTKVLESPFFAHLTYEVTRGR